MRNTFLTDKELINESPHDSSLSIIGIDISSLELLGFVKVWPQLLHQQKLRLAWVFEYSLRIIAMLNSLDNEYIMHIWLPLIRLERIHERCTLFLDYDLQKTRTTTLVLTLLYKKLKKNIWYQPFTPPPSLSWNVTLAQKICHVSNF